MKRRRTFSLLAMMVLLFVGACGVWLRVQRQQYALNRQLIEALMRDDTKTAFALVNAGADPNTRQSPSHAPSLKSLLDQFLHHSKPPANISPTAFLFVCGAYALSVDKNRLAMPMPKENLSLLRAMLAHGADPNIKSQAGYTPLSLARQKNLSTLIPLLRRGAKQE